MNRRLFLTASTAALGLLSVRELTDGHDEWLFERDADGVDRVDWDRVAPPTEGHADTRVRFVTPDGGHLRAVIDGSKATYTADGSYEVIGAVLFIPDFGDVDVTFPQRFVLCRNDSIEMDLATVFS